MFDHFENILVLAPHTDDGEFGCGGAIARFIDNGKTVRYVAFSAAEESVPAGFDKDVLKLEVREATRSLGIAEESLSVLGYPVRNFPQHRQAILDDMILLRGEFNPDLVLLPSTADIHQDHATIVAEGIRAFKKTTMLGYEVPWNNFNFNMNGYIALTEDHVNRKIEALKCYRSQAGRDYSSAESIRSIAKVRGLQISKPYAELFEIIRWIVD